MFNQIIQISAQIAGKRVLDFKIVRGSIPPPAGACLRHAQVPAAPAITPLPVSRFLGTPLRG